MLALKPNKVINVLLVDDNPDDVEFTIKGLKRYSPKFQVDNVANGRSCLELLTTTKYNIILLDYSLPEMDGLGVLEELSKSGIDIPIIMLTGKRDENIAIHSIKRGAYDYIVKSEHYITILPIIIEKVIEKYEIDVMKKRLEEETLDKKSKLEATLNSTSDGILVLSYMDSGDIITVCNKKLGELLGINTESVINSGIEFFEEIKWNYKNPNEFMSIVNRLRVNRSIEAIDVLEIARPAHIIVEQYSGPVYDNKNNKIIGRIWSFRDVTERKKLEQELKKLSITDNLTKLYNQGHFYVELEKEIERAKRQKNPLSLLLFDIDKFKEYNDAYGHQEGDNLIKQIGEIVFANIRENVDTGYRYGGDEFTIILPEANINQAKIVAERIRTSFARQSFSTLSIGLVEYRENNDVKSFVKSADEAMYIAKNSSGNKIVIYDPDINKKYISDCLKGKDGVKSKGFNEVEEDIEIEEGIMIFKGKTWKFGSNIDTDIIIPARYLNTFDPYELAKHCMEDIDVDFIRKISNGDIIVAEKNFGCGSSREHAPIAIKYAGISCVIAESFARIFYRNSFNAGLPIVECSEVNNISQDDELVVDMANGIIKNISKDEEYNIKPIPPFMESLLKAGGLMEYVKRKMKEGAV